MQHSFEFDEAKSCSKKSKHGIAFLEAQALWLGSDLLRLTANCETEPRYLFIGKVGGRHWSAIATYRGESIRLISVRRSRPQEVEAYEGE